MKISISGAQSTGKTTILQYLKKDSTITAKFKLVEEITRNVRRKGLDINNKGKQYDITQLLIMSGHIENSLIKNSILDRCALDGLAYTTYLYRHGEVKKWIYDYAVNVFKMLIPKYDVIFFTPLEFEIEDDGVRSTDKEFRDEIVKIFDEIISKYKVNIIYLTGSISERLEMFKSHIKYK